MKPIKRLYLSGDEVHLVDATLALELSACGRGFITAQTDTDYTGKMVRLDVGYPELVLRWFTGYVERSQSSETAISACLCVSWSGYLSGHGHALFSIPHYARLPNG